MSMSHFVARRTVGAAASVTLLALLLFLMIWAIPSSATDAERRAAQRGSDSTGQLADAPYWPFDGRQPFVPQFLSYLQGTLRLRFGSSYSNGDATVHSVMARSLPVTLQVAGWALLAGLLIGLPLGIAAALRPASTFSRAARAVSLLGRSVPALVLGPILLGTFALALGWFPAADTENLWRRTVDNPGLIFSAAYLHIASLPVLSLAVGVTAVITNWARVTLVELRRQRVISPHGMTGWRARERLLQHMAMDLAEIAMPVAAATIVGSFVVEWIFRIPGAGSVFILAIKTRDYNMIAGLVVLYSVGMAVGNLLVDVISAWIDPRVWTA